MSILVTGGAGFVGSHLVRQLVEAGQKVKVLVRPTSNLGNLAGLEFEKAVGDLRDYDSLVKAVEGCDLVYHCAADYRLWASDPRELYTNNVQGTDNLLRACQKGKVERVVVTSSVAAVGIPKGGGEGNEDTPVTLEDMVGDYKRSKFLAEKLAVKYAQEGQDIVIVNPSTPIGDGDSRPTDTGKSITRFLNGQMPAFVNTGLNLVDVEDVCKGHILAAQKGQSGRRYILGGYNMSLEEILQELADITGLEAPKVELPWQFAYVIGFIDTALCVNVLKREPHVPLDGVKMARKKMYFSWDRAYKELGYLPGSVRVALQKAVAWFIKNGYAPNFGGKR
ncbi:NAD-dependent epimerase/dehydratase family protein [bacterium]|nr:NAD-dependent epimerase/dehydratase family protein [bacterium]